MKNLGLATVGGVLKKEILESEDFSAAKKGSDIDAAARVVDQVWKRKKTDQLSKSIDENTVFLSMPSTTKQNILPAVMAIKLSDDLGSSMAYGDDLFNTLHGTASKKIGRDKRVFNARKYSVVDQEDVTSQLKGKKVVLVDDIINTGSSIRHFVEFLRKNDIQVSHVACLMGDRRLALDEKTEKKLEIALRVKKVGIAIDTINYITRAEAGGLLRRLNQLKSENGIRKFAEDLQGIQRQPSPENTKRYTRRRKHGRQGGDRGDEQLRERVPANSCSSVGSENEKSKVNSPGPSMIAYGFIETKGEKELLQNRRTSPGLKHDLLQECEDDQGGRPKM